MIEQNRGGDALVKDTCLVRFLQDVLPHLGLEWAGFRKVRGQVRKRLSRRIRELELEDLVAYRAHLDRHPGEWKLLAEMCRITISRFFRDRGVWADLEAVVLPALESGRPGTLFAWSAGCASGEEPYSLVIALLGSGLDASRWRVTATDVDPVLLGRAERGIYPWGATREVSSERRARVFEAHGPGELRLEDSVRSAVRFERRDVEAEPPEGAPFDLILCRNLAFTYFGPKRRRVTADRLFRALRADGALVIGKHEQLPDGSPFRPWVERSGIFRPRRL